MRILLAVVISTFVAGFPADAKPVCDDPLMLQQFISEYFGLNGYRGATEAQIREEVIAAPEMQYWKKMSSESEVGKEIVNWIIGLDVEAIRASQGLVRAIRASSISEFPSERTYTCHVIIEFNDEELISYLSLVILNSWLQSAGAVRELSTAASLNDPETWRITQTSLNNHLRKMAQKLTSCVRNRVIFTLHRRDDDFYIEPDLMPALDPNCVIDP